MIRRDDRPGDHTTTLDEPGLDDRPAGPSSTTGRTPTSWWGVVWFAVGALLGARALSDNSFLTHLATGRIIWSDGAPHADPYSFTRAGADWVVQSWGASWGYAGLEQAFGPGAIRLVVAVLAGTLLALTWRLTRPAEGLLGRVLVLAFAAATQFAGWSERPQVLAFVLLATTVLILVEGRSAGWLVPMFALWVNVHGSFPIGIAAVGLIGFALWTEREQTLRRLFTTGLAAAGGAVAGALVSPYGVALLTFPIELLGRSEVLGQIEEWRSPTLAEPTTWFAIGLGALALCSVVRRRAWGWLPLLVTFGAMGVTSRRNLVVAAIVCVPAAARGLAGIGSIRVGRPPSRARMAVAGAGVVGVIAVMVAATPAYDFSDFPKDPVTWMDERGLVASPEVEVMTHDYVGNYLEWRFGTDARVFLDDRAELYGVDIMDDYGSLAAGEDDFDAAEWAGILDEHDIDAVLWRRKEYPFLDELEGSADWSIGYRDDRWLVACRVATVGAC